MVLYVVSLPLPVGHDNGGWFNPPLYGITCLLLGWIIPFIWIANPFVFTAWFLNSKNTKGAAIVALTLSFLAVLISAATELAMNEPFNQIGPALWTGAMIVTFIGSIRNLVLISGNETKSALGMNR